MYEKKRGRPLRGFRFEFTKAKDKPIIEEVVPDALPEPAKKKAMVNNNNNKKPANRFHNFDQRVYDYDQLEIEILRQQELEEEEKKEKT